MCVWSAVGNGSVAVGPVVSLVHSIRAEQEILVDTEIFQYLSGVGFGVKAKITFWTKLWPKQRQAKITSKIPYSALSGDPTGVTLATNHFFLH